MNKEVASGIYKIINLVNGKFYIGSSCNLKAREYDHFRTLENNCHRNKYLQHAYNKYGKYNFKFEIIEVFKNAPKDKKELKDLLLEREQYYLDILQPFGETGYNFLPTAGSNLGIKFSDESKKKMSLSRIGKNHWTTKKSFTEEAKVKMSESNTTSIPILQFSKNGDLIKKWNGGAYQASKKLALDQGNIWNCLNKRTKTHGEFIWIYESEYKEFGINLNDYKQNTTRKIIQLDLNDNVINVWNSIIEAEKALGINNSLIVRVCKKKRNHTHGFKFMYEEDYKNN